jgi:hypothetical protein
MIAIPIPTSPTVAMMMTISRVMLSSSGAGDVTLFVVVVFVIGVFVAELVVVIEVVIVDVVLGMNTLRSTLEYEI